MPEAKETIIAPPKRWLDLDLPEIWHYRELLTTLVWRDFSSRYRQSVIGIGWAVIRPILSVLVFTIIFGKAIKIPSDGIPYPIFSFAALLPWMYFAGCLTGASASVVGGSGLLTKVYFPRLILPLSKVVIGLIDFSIQFVLLVVLMIWYDLAPTWRLLAIPGFVLICVFAALSISLWLTAINVKYRDVGQAVPFLVQTWMWMTPIVYSSNVIPSQWKALYYLNPMVGVVDGFRWAVAGRAAPDWSMMTISLSVILIMLTGGLIYFQRAEKQFADVI